MTDQLPPLDLDRYPLEHEYSPSRWCKRSNNPDVIIENYLNCLSTGSAIARDLPEKDLDIPFINMEQHQIHPTAETSVDLFYPSHIPKDKRADLPVLIFLHGGYWIYGSKSISSFFAKAFTDAGVIVGVVGYDLAPAVNIKTMILQTKLGIATIHQKLPKNKLYFIGHSVGAHLVAMALCSTTLTDWKSIFNVDATTFAGAIFNSGVFDARHVLQTSMNDLVKLANEQEADEISPQNFISSFPNYMKYLVTVGEFDPPAFIQQSEMFYKTLSESLLPFKEQASVKYNFVQGCDHFDYLQDLDKPIVSNESALPVTRLILEMLDVKVSKN